MFLFDTRGHNYKPLSTFIVLSIFLWGGAILTVRELYNLDDSPKFSINLPSLY